jgi:hypothetical protein
VRYEIRDTRCGVWFMACGVWRVAYGLCTVCMYVCVYVCMYGMCTVCNHSPLCTLHSVLCTLHSALYTPHAEVLLVDFHHPGVARHHAGGDRLRVPEDHPLPLVQLVDHEGNAENHGLLPLTNQWSVGRSATAERLLEADPEQAGAPLIDCCADAGAPGRALELDL